jgi:hypothetical protein
MVSRSSRGSAVWIASQRARVSTWEIRVNCWLRNLHASISFDNPSRNFRGVLVTYVSSLTEDSSR